MVVPIGPGTFTYTPAAGSQGIANPAYAGVSGLPSFYLWDAAPPAGTAAAFTTEPFVEDVTLLGSASLDLAYVAAGRYDGYWERDVQLWDMAAGILLVREAGGFVGTIEDGGELFADRNLAAANANVYETFRKVLRSA